MVMMVPAGAVNASITRVRTPAWTRSPRGRRARGPASVAGPAGVPAAPGLLVHPRRLPPQLAQLRPLLAQVGPVLSAMAEVRATATGYGEVRLIISGGEVKFVNVTKPAGEKTE